MRILFTISHFHDPKGSGQYGSLKPRSSARRDALARTVFSLHSTFGRRQAFLAPRTGACNASQSADLQVVVCTTADRHLLGELRKVPGLHYLHQPTAAEPLYLGFECHEVLKRNLGNFDYFCFLEDDIALTDPLFFQKLEWFNALAGDEAVLQPNRFETAADQPWQKLYIDGQLAQPEWSERWQDVHDRPSIDAEAFGTPVRFVRSGNPHSGCFFLNARQMARWAAQSDFLVRAPHFVGPLETAATYGVMRHFRAYKPAPDNAGFLEVQHLDNRYLGVARRPARAAASTARP
ncbi:MAG: calcium-binding protein [Candidatus Parcubacteria bacterium]|nr:calcium-binding protein [Burkholderiales bacterium]